MSLSSLFQLGKSKSSARPAKAQRSQMQFEILERRELLVVAADGLAEAVAVGAGFDGVVQLGFPNGGCTGSLLWTGRHILTAAHCVDGDVDSDGDGNNDRGNGVVDPGTASVRFDMPGRAITQFAPMTNVTVHPLWNGTLAGNDLAIVTLPELAPSGRPGVTGAERYQIYRSSDEVTQIFNLVGYGRTNGVGGTIDNSGPGGTKRQGQNRFDSASGTFLNFDFDGATAGTAVANESNTAPGDSGGPSFLGGTIAAVTSGGRLTNSGLGDNSFNTRVSQFAAWIDGVVAGAYDLVLDMSNQIVGDNGRTDTIRVQRSGANLELIVNGQVYHSDTAGNIRSLTIRGSGDADYIELLTSRSVTIDGRAGTNTLVAPNQVNGWLITGTDRGRIGDWANFSAVQNIKGNANTDIFSFENGARVTGAINGGGGIDVLDYEKYTTSVDVNLLTGRATATGSVAYIEDVKGGSGNDILVGDTNANHLAGNGGHDILDGGDGVDSLFGGDGNDLLIGGLGADRLDGQGHDDILIGGRLTVSSTAVRSEWMRTDNSYDSRVANLRNGTGRNGSARLTLFTVLDDGASDQITGGGGADWFWALPGEITDREFDFARGRFELIS